nr:cytochrome p450 82a3 [Quercus suber]
MDFLSPSLYSAIAGLIAIILFSHYLLKRSRVGLAKTVPIAPGAWPVIGHLPLLGGNQPPHLTLGAMADKYGPLFTIKLGLHPALVVSSWDMAKECFSTNDLAVSSRPSIVAAKHMGYNYAMFNFAPHGPYWRELRKIITLELLSTRRLDELAYIRVSEVEMFLKGLYKLWTKEKDGSSQILVELKQWFGDMSLNVILRMIAGKRYFGVNHDDVHEKEARCCQKADAVPYLGWLDLGGHEKAMKRTAKQIDHILGEWLEEHKRKRASGETKEQDFMDVMLSATNGADLGGYDPDTVNKATCLNLIAGGNDPIVVSLTWATSLLLNNRHDAVPYLGWLDLGGHEKAMKRTAKQIDHILGEWLEEHKRKRASGETKEQDFMDVMLSATNGADLGGYDPDTVNKATCLNLIAGGNDPIVVSLTWATSLLLNNRHVDMTESFGLTNLKATPLEVLITPRLHLTSFMG